MHDIASGFLVAIQPKNLWGVLELAKAVVHELREGDYVVVAFPMFSIGGRIRLVAGRFVIESARDKKRPLEEFQGRVITLYEETPSSGAVMCEGVMEPPAPSPSATPLVVLGRLDDPLALRWP